MSTDTQTVDLRDPDRQLTDSETSDVIHRAGYPRSAVSAAYDTNVLALMTHHAATVADVRSGVPRDLPRGPHHNRGTLRWYRHYLAVLDQIADALVPRWRDQPETRCPQPWCEVAFGSATRGKTAPSPGEDDLGYTRDPNDTVVIGYWTFPLPPAWDTA